MSENVNTEPGTPGIPGDEVPGTNVFIQYKGTDLCADLYCDCGTHLHYDGYFAYAVKCWGCGSVWELPQMVTMKKVESSRWTPILLEKDDD